MTLSLRPAVIATTSILISITAGPAIAVAQSGATPAPPVTYTIAKWNADSLGNHRAVVHVDAPGGAHPDAVHAYIPWRRRDSDPDKKNIVVIDAATGARVMNVARISITRQSGDIVFQPATVPGDYDVYFMPYRRANKSANYPKIVYPAPEATADAAWIARNHLSDASATVGDWKSLPTARVVSYQSVDSLDAFTQMEIIATRDEMQTLLTRNPGAAYLVFPEDRSNSIRMSEDLPRRWIEAGANAPFRGSAQRGEFYVYQIGVFAARQSLTDVRTVFSKLTGPGGSTIPASRIEDFNTGGVNWI